MKMKNLIWLLIFIAGCTAGQEEGLNKISLSGVWKFGIDSLNTGTDQKWYEAELTDSVILPGSMAENGKGNEVTISTDWTGQIVDKSYFTLEKYKKYRQPGNIKIPFWLKPVKYYKGVAWYQKEVEIPEGWSGKRVTLFMERCHWESAVFVNGKKTGTQNSLAVPHTYDITDMLDAGKNRITMRIDNRIIIPVGVNSHSISDHTQSNWNGITGELSLYASSMVYVKSISIFPDITGKRAKVKVNIENTSGKTFKGKLEIFSENSKDQSRLKRKVVKIESGTGSVEIALDYPMGRKPRLWSEFNPVVYELTGRLKDESGKIIDTKTEDFGMREFKTSGTRFTVNGTPVFLRGTTECCIFPLTGYPPTDVESWERVLKSCKDYGLNHVRFHSFCPPEAAFIAADKLGIYFHIECSSWANQGSSIGDGETLDRFIYDEGERIMHEYGNHPSFCMLAYGNEPAGRNLKKYLGDLVGYWKAKDDRRVYTAAAGWPYIPENDYNLIPEPRIQQWGEGLRSIINARPPQSRYDFKDIISKYNIPTVSHEIGQWCAYPDFKEIEKYTGVLKATNFEIFRETLNGNNMGDKAEEFLSASGKLQVLCYKAEIEAALRTPGFGGFQLLQLHDFPGQGTALVGILNAFFESKGYVTPEEFRMFCNETVPLARMNRMVYTNAETLQADIEIAHFGAEPLNNATILSKVFTVDNRMIFKDSITMKEINIGNCISAGSVKMDLKNITSAQKLKFEVSIKNTDFRNNWDFWVYPETSPADQGNILITDKLDRSAEEALKKGGSVLLLTYGKVGKTKGSQVAVGFSSIFWNTAWTRNQAPHTMGILCDPENPLFKDFPTEYHSNWQWWDPVTHSQAMILDDFPAEVRPLVQLIDTWFENRRLATVFEIKAGGGKLMICSIDMENIAEGRSVSKQLYNSILNYMNSGDFMPEAEADLNLIKNLMN